MHLHQLPSIKLHPAPTVKLPLPFKVVAHTLHLPAYPLPIELIAGEGVKVIALFHFVGLDLIIKMQVCHPLP